MHKSWDQFTKANGGGEYSEYLEHEQERFCEYLKHELTKAVYVGPLCERLGVERGAVVKNEEFQRVANNRHAITDEQQLTKEVPGRKMFCDNTLSMSKTFSVMWLRDKRFLDWHRAAKEKVKDAYSQVIGCQANNRNGNTEHMEYTGSWAGTEIEHFFTRAGDIGIHSHITVWNVTECQDHKLRAIEFREVMMNSGFLTALYRDEMMRLAEAVGYNVTIDKETGAPEISELMYLIPRFSKRTSDLELVAKVIQEHARMELNKEEIGMLVRSSRGFREEQFKREWDVEKAKFPEMLDPNTATEDRLKMMRAFSKIVGRCSDQRLLPDPEQCVEENLNKFTPDDERVIAGVLQRLHPKVVKKPPLAQCVDHAVLHCFENKSVVQERDLAKEAINKGLGRGTDRNELRAVLRAHPGVQFGRYGEVASSKHYRQEKESELRMLEGRDRGVAVGIEGVSNKLSPAQHKCVNELTESRQRFTFLSGSSGVGKSEYIIPALIAQNLKAGYRVQVTAPSDKARDMLIRAAAELPPEMDAVAAVLRATVSIQMYRRNAQLRTLQANDLLIIDEASFLDLEHGHWAFEQAEKERHRVCLTGDLHQGNSVKAGDFARFVYSRGIFTAELHDIRRQTEEALDGKYRKAVKLLKKGETLLGLSLLDSAGVFEVVAGKDKYEREAELYLGSRDEGVDALIGHVTHAECDQASTAVRSRLKERGVITDCREMDSYRTLGWSDARKKGIADIPVGSVLEETKGKAKGRAWYVFENDNGVASARTADGLLRKFTERDYKSFDVCEQRRIEVGVGDYLFGRSTKKGKTGIKNQEKFRVDGFDNEGRIVSGGRGIDHENITHAYASTAAAVQGDSTTRIISGMDMHTVALWTRQIAYVIAGRGRKFFHCLVDNKAALAQIVDHSSERKAASDMVLTHDDVLPPDIASLVKRIEKVKASQMQQEPDKEKFKTAAHDLTVDLQPGKRRVGEKEQAQMQHMIDIAIAHQQMNQDIGYEHER